LLQGGVPGGGLTAPEQLRLESVSYDDAGDFDISGTAIPGNMIAAYLDNQPIGSTPVDTEGQWRLLPDKVIDPGLYTLRIDQVDKSGLVISRLETPFSIADLTNTAIAEGLVVVQPGNSLWRIARRIYGKGVEHTVIYQANSDQIRDPDLIYPGQIFIVPGESSDG
jgi:nucleoid-associated protein YgaU